MEGICLNCGEEGNWCECEEPEQEYEEQDMESRAQLLWQDGYSRLTQTLGVDFLDFDHSMNF